jgi:four helix bundle protein
VGNPSNLVVLDKAHALLERVNEAVTSIRQSHLGDLKKQLMKSALSIPSNIAEGRRKTSQREFLRFLDIALGSTGELETQLRAAKIAAQSRWTSYLTWQNVRTKSGK